MATHASILAWRIPWIEEPGGLYSPRGHKESDTTEQVHFSFSPRVQPRAGDRLSQRGELNMFWKLDLVTTWKVKVKVAQSDSLRPHGLYNPQNSPGQNIGVGSLSLLQGIFPTQGSNPSLPHCRRVLYQLSHKGSPHTSIKRNKIKFLKNLFKHTELHLSLCDWNLTRVT